jgi:hypothetical protein
VRVPLRLLILVKFAEPVAARFIASVEPVEARFAIVAYVPVTVPLKLLILVVRVAPVNARFAIVAKLLFE